jgi:hypothetical protein
MGGVSGDVCDGLAKAGGGKFKLQNPNFKETSKLKLQPDDGSERIVWCV